MVILWGRGWLLYLTLHSWKNVFNKGVLLWYAFIAVIPVLQDYTIRAEVRIVWRHNATHSYVEPTTVNQFDSEQFVSNCCTVSDYQRVFYVHRLEGRIDYFSIYKYPIQEKYIYKAGGSAVGMNSSIWVFYRDSHRTGIYFII